MHLRNFQAPLGILQASPGSLAFWHQNLFSVAFTPPLPWPTVFTKSKNMRYTNIFQETYIQSYIYTKQVCINRPACFCIFIHLLHLSAVFLNRIFVKLGCACKGDKISSERVGRNNAEKVGGTLLLQVSYFCTNHIISFLRTYSIKLVFVPVNIKIHIYICFCL